MAIARQRISVPPGSWRGAVGGWLRGNLWEGDDIARFERAFADFMGVPQAVAVPSGRAGLRFIFEALQLEPDAEVICSAFGYPVVPFIVKTLGYRLRFVDCELQTLGMAPEALRAAVSNRTGAVIATHLYGVPCRIPEIVEIAEAQGAAVVEDCAHCYGAAVSERKSGAWGQAGYFSFETSKVINTMGGGMITARDDAFAERVRQAAQGEARKSPSWLMKRLLRTSFEATVTHPLAFNTAVYPALRFLPRKKGDDDRFASGYHGDEVSLRGKMGRYTNYQARLGLRQMERIGPSVERRIENAQRLIGQLRDVVRFQEPAGEDVRPNYMLVTALFPDMPRVSDELLRLGVDTKHHYMRDCSGLFDTQETFPNAARAEREALHLPAYPELSDARIDAIAAAVRRAVAQTGSASS